MSDRSIPGLKMYTVLAGAKIVVPVIDEYGDHVGEEIHILTENVSAYFEGKRKVKTKVEKDDEAY